MLFPRLDRAASVYLVGPIVRRVRSANRRAIPILMYHSISSISESRVHPYFRLNTSTSVFESHLRFLRANHYATVTLDHALSLLSENKPFSGRAVAITFDDGYRDFYSEAFPLLQRYGFTATVFLPTAHIGTRRRTFREIECLTWNEVRELSRHGMAFGSHTVSHPHLEHLEKTQVEWEISHSKGEIEDQTGSPVTSFSYPYRFPQDNPQFMEFLANTLAVCGYRHTVSTIIGTATAADGPFRLRRLPVNSEDDIPLFRAKLEGGYDWLCRPQNMFKSVKNYHSARFATKPELI